MEVGKLMGNTTPRDNNSSKDDEVMPPGFRFHPTDEELVGFYLRREVENKPICIELIKRVDIYKYDPWDLPGVSTVGDKEWYFFCIRGRKYRNSIRPNRVTGSGYWKATGIDKPIYSTGGGGRGATSKCIGLKKSLVYYRGSAGKGGTKTDWMMHEFRLPPINWKNNNNNQSTTTASRNITQEAEVWTLCRIFKRNASYKKHIPADWNEAAAAAAAIEQSLTSTDHAAASSKTDSFEYSNQKKYMNLVDLIVQQKERKPVVAINHVDERNDQLLVGQQNSSVHELADHSVLTTTAPPHLSSWNNLNRDDDDDDDYKYFFRHENNWDELRSVVGLAIDSSINYYDRVQ